MTGPAELAAAASPALPWVEELVVKAIVDLSVRREPRDHCAVCRRRRVLYRLIVADSTGYDQTSARCAPCWGIRHEEPD